MAGHTEGTGEYQPMAWQIVSDASGLSVHETDEDGKPGDLVADVWGGHSALIAAAPDLLQAAKTALNIADNWIHDQLGGTTSREGALIELDPVRAAIARATGAE